MAFFKEELKHIKAFIFDIDGVLSLDTTPLAEDGNPMRTANVKDGFAIRHAIVSGYEVAIITGAGGGIGRGVAEMFANAGAQVAVCDLDYEAAKVVADRIHAADGKAIQVACDVTDDLQLENLVDRTLDAFGKITILINNAGGGGAKPFNMSMDTFVWAFKLNVFSVFRLWNSANCFHRHGMRK